MTEQTVSPPSKTLLLGLCLTAAATVLFELMLTRLFSVTAGYHFAFLIVSIAMFGMTLGALVTFGRIKYDALVVANSLVTNACYFSISVGVAVLIYNITCLVQANTPAVMIVYKALGVFLWTAGSFVLFAIPFYFSGICTCLCLSRFAETGKLYCADLVGAALSCPLLVLSLFFLDCQSVLSLTGLLSAIACICFTLHKTKIAQTKQGGNPFTYCVVATVFSLTMLFLPRFPLKPPLELEKWSPIGRVLVKAEKDSYGSYALEKEKQETPIDAKELVIDVTASTHMLSGKTTAEQLKAVKRDITAVGNYLRPATSLFVIGVGGGRDILTGLLFDQKEIDGIEVNPAIVDLIKNRYGEFDGHLCERAGVNIINDEARSWLGRSDKKYGVIQCSLVDTWAASSSGAYMLTENVIYTKEAFEMFLQHLRPDGLLSFLRWGDEKEPGQLMRMLNISRSGLAKLGATDFGSHVMVMTAPFKLGEHSVGLVLVSPKAFTEDDVKKAAEFAQSEGYKPLWLPGPPGQKARVAVEPFASWIVDASVINPGLPTDDCPFFFTPVNAPKYERDLSDPGHSKGLMLLLYTFALSFFLVLTTIVAPSWTKLKSKLGTTSDIQQSALFFSLLGLGFMQVEMGLVERLTVMLGNPTYSLSVVLFSLLLSSGLGSYTADILLKRGHQAGSLLKNTLLASVFLIVASAVSSLFTLQTIAAASAWVRILAAIVFVTLPAFFMGWSFPLGMTFFTKRNPESGAWFWAVNGATSVLGSVLAAIFSVVFGITTTILIGAGIYLLAYLLITKAHGKAT